METRRSDSRQPGASPGDATTVVRSLQSAAEFLEVAGTLLVGDEPRHNLILGLASTLRDHPARYPEHRFWVAERDGAPVAAALRTPPHNLVLARPTDHEALDVLAAGIDDNLPGATGALPEVDRFATAWCARRRASQRLARSERIHAATAITPVDGVPGIARPPAADERELVLDWYRAFAVEAVGEDPGDERLERTVDHMLTAPGAGILLWDDGGPASLAGFGDETPNGVRIGPVYTPPERRGRGYASALVAELSQRLLDGGRRFCFLFTDLANPTANRLYARLGYEPVCDAAEIAFDEP